MKDFIKATVATVISAVISPFTKCNLFPLCIHVSDPESLFWKLEKLGLAVDGYDVPEGVRCMGPKYHGSVTLCKR